MNGARRSPRWFALYAALALLFLLSFGPAATATPERYVQWNAALFGLAVVALGVALLATRRDELDLTARWVMGTCGLLAGLMLVNGLGHWWATYQLPGSQYVNVSRLTAEVWRDDVVKFSIFYLFFPLLFALQAVVLRRVGRRLVVHCLALATVAGLAVQGYQALVDPSWLNVPRWVRLARYGGLSTDPNAFALTGFLLLPLFVHAAVVSRSRRLTLLYGLLTALTVSGIVLTGSRTGAGGLFLLAAALPAMIAAVRRDWPRRRRLLLTIAPAVILTAALALAPVAFRFARGGELGVLGGRLAETWDRYQDLGLRGVFFVREGRGSHYVVAGDLLTAAPLAGWGPGGFYREYPNQWYRSTGSIQPARDSALNHYLMVGSDLGLVTLAVDLLLVLAPLGLAIAVWPRLSKLSERVFVVGVGATNLVFLLMIVTVPPANFADVVWVWTAELSWLTIIAGRYLGAPPVQRRPRRLAGVAVSSLLVAAVAFGAYRTTFGELGYRARHRTAWWPHDQMAGYQLESWPEGTGRWSGKEAFVKIPLAEPETDEVVLEIKASHPDIEDRPLTVRYGGPGGARHELVLRDSLWHELVIPASSEYLLQTSAAKRTTRSLGVSLEVSRTWVPREWGMGDDPRQLGIAYLLPNPGADRQR